MLDEVVARRAHLGDAPRGGDMVGGDAVPQSEEDAGTLHALRWLQLVRQVGEERRLLDVGALGIPVVELAGARRHGVPARVGLPHVVVALLELRRLDGRFDRLPHLFSRWPDLPQIDRLAVGAGTDRLVVEIDVGRAGQGVSDDQRGAGEPVGLHERIDSALKITVAGEDRRGDEIPLLHGLGDMLREGPGVADAGRAAVADSLEAERVEIGGQPRLLEVVRDDPRSRREARLHPRLDGEPAGHRLPRHEPRGDHHARVARVGAAGDRGDHDSAMVDRGGVAVLCHRAGLRQGSGIKREATLRRRGGE